MNDDEKQPTEGRLPILGCVEEIERTILRHPVVIIRGATGSGKTTQLPQICLRAGLAKTGLIACTQPRRIAAVTVAERVADELGAARNLVGWQHRFARHMPEQAKIKFMTDGVLLAELRGDPLLRRYQTIIVDEAHERTLNIDFILGCLKKLLPRRPDLKVILSSATLETGPFSEFFGGAPVLEIPGRTYPVEVVYRPREDEDDDVAGAVADAVEECLARSGEGDILVFLPGERDIRASTQAVEGRALPNVVAIPLLASLPPGEQRRAFMRMPGKRRVVLATNVAETSVTIPGIRFVIDSGLARISRYSARARVKRLHIEPISQAAAEQRKGRCGRLGPGVCIRLYSREDFEKRDAFTEPDIRRASLAGAILSMLDWRLGDIDTFPFLQPPAATAMREGYRELLALGAIQERESPGATRYRLTPLGRRIVRLPIDPALSRMLFEADRQGALRDALIVVSALSCEDPLVRPAEKSAEAEAAHAAFRDKTSDFLGLLRLWNRFHDPATPLTRTALRRACQKNFVSYRKLCEWEDVHKQLCDLLRREKLTLTSDVGGTAGLHKALLSGLLGNIGRYDAEARNYAGANGSRFWLFPGSGLAKAKKSPDWIMCAERVDTSRLYARRAAAIDPMWIEPLARHLVRYSYSAESWDPVAGSARALRKAILYGLTVQENVRCDISRVNPALAREIFIREGLVLGAFPKPVPPVIRDNIVRVAQRIESTQKDRSGSAELIIDAACAFYDEGLPPSCVNVPVFRDWLKTLSPEAQEKLRLDADEAPAAKAGDYPDHLLLGERRLRLTYVHKPDSEADGITCSMLPAEIPLLPLWESTRLVPGALRGKVLYLIRTLPHAALMTLAAHCTGKVRALDTAAMAEQVLAQLPPEGPLIDALVTVLDTRFGLRLPRDYWSEEELPPAFRMRWRIVSRDGQELFVSRSLAEILDFHAEFDRLAPGTLPPRTDFRFPQARGLVFSESVLPLPSAPSGAKKGGGTAAPLSAMLPPLPDAVRIGRLGKQPLWAVPAAVPEGGASLCRAHAVAVRLFPTHAAARAATPRGAAALALAAHRIVPPPGASPILEFAMERAALECAESHPAQLRDPAAIRALAADIRTLAELAAEEAHALLNALADSPTLAAETVADIAEQIGWLTPERFPATIPSARLAEYPRYLEAIRKRLERAWLRPADDVRLLRPVRTAWQRYADLITDPLGHPPYRPEAAERYRWLVEEFRVAVFAQILGTAVPASVQRLDRLWQEVTQPQPTP